MAKSTDSRGNALIDDYARNVVPYVLLLLGVIILILAAYYSSYVPGFVGLGLVFWGSLFLYVKSTKYVEIELLTAASSSSLDNIERILSNAKTASKGIYLPPKNLQDYTSSLVFVPKAPPNMLRESVVTVQVVNPDIGAETAVADLEKANLPKDTSETSESNALATQQSAMSAQRLELVETSKKRKTTLTKTFGGIFRNKETVEEAQEQPDTTTAEEPKQALPTTNQTGSDTFEIVNPEGLLITPPGLALSKLFERELRSPFTETSLEELQTRLPKLFDQLQITKHLTVQTQNSQIQVTIENHVFEDLCRDTDKLERTHKTVGCPLTSALACAFAKATGKPVSIEKEETTTQGTTTIRYSIMEI